MDPKIGKLMKLPLVYTEKNLQSLSTFLNRRINFFSQFPILKFTNFFLRMNFLILTDRYIDLKFSVHKIHLSVACKKDAHCLVTILQ